MTKMRKYLLPILCVFTLILGSAGVFALQKQEVKNIGIKSEEKTRLPLLADGIFSAEVGMKECESFIFFDGNFQVKGKIIYCDGIAKIKDKEGGFIEGKFDGIFKGEYFGLKIVIEEKEKPFVIEGCYKLDKNGQVFQGLCIKGKDKKVEWGWIKGLFKGLQGEPILEGFPLLQKLLQQDFGL
jgi:hypothetical protein